MRNILVSIATQSEQVPVGPAQAGIVITLSNFAPQTVSAAPFEALFKDVPAGTYTATAQAVDVDSNPIGASVTSSPFDVIDLTMSVETPVSITISTP